MVKNTVNANRQYLIPFIVPHSRSTLDLLLEYFNAFNLFNPCFGKEYLELIQFIIIIFGNAIRKYESAGMFQGRWIESKI